MTLKDVIKNDELAEYLQVLKSSLYKLAQDMKVPRPEGRKALEIPQGADRRVVGRAKIRPWIGGTE